MKLIISMDTNTNVYGCVLTVKKGGCFLFIVVVFNINFSWYNLLTRVVIMIIVIREKTLNKKGRRKEQSGWGG